MHSHSVKISSTMSKFIILLISVTYNISLILSPVECARILVVFPYPSKSHMVVFSTLTRELVKRGHEMVVISSFPLSKPMLNYTDIDLTDVMKPLHEAIFSPDVYQLSDFPIYLIPSTFWAEGLAVTEACLRHPNVQQLLHDKKGFDLIVVEGFIHEALYGFAYHFQAPLMLISSMSGMHWINYIVGTPFPLSYSPNPMLTYTDHMTFWERAGNTIFTTLWNIGNQLYYFPRQEALMKSVFGDGCLSISELNQKVELVLLNNHFSLNFPRPLVPAMIEVGGMHVSRTTHPLPVDIQTFLDEAQHGAIYFSMGSNLRSDQMPEDKLVAFVAAFSEIPQRVLWKWESDILPKLPANIKLGKWLPQQDILAHPNVKLFITHGGLLSAQEAIYHGVPLLGIPVFGDQMLNMKKAVLGGYGVMVTFENVTKESLLWALDKSLHDPSIKMETERRTSIFLDQLDQPLERAIYWTEYLLRHRGAPHLHSAATRLAWYQLHLLDVAAVLLVALVFLVLILWGLLRLVCGKQVTNESKNTSINKKMS